MTGLKEIRLKHNLSLSALAMLLQVSKSLVSMAEAGKRSLPLNAWLKLAQLEQNSADARNNKSNTATPLLPMEIAMQQASIKELQKQIRNGRFNLEVLERRLQKMQSRYDNAIATLRTIAEERENTNMAGQDPMYINWLERRESAAKLQLYKHPQIFIINLELKVVGMRAQLHAAEEKLQILF